MALRNIKLTIHYDGSRYHGWASQPGKPTIQGTMEDALERLLCDAVDVNGSSRTDAGVSALGQVANIKVDSPVPVQNFTKALNKLLPPDIAIAEAVEVDADFDAISSTRSKLYRYTIYTGHVRPVLEVSHCWHWPGQLNVEAMAQAAKVLVGAHDFKSFASASDKRSSSVRTLMCCNVWREGDRILFDTEASGFLYNMVRNIVGTLVEVGRGRWKPDDVKKILDARDRKAAGPIAPASGLCLMWIKY
jgi:tRNA pseudouridine38-40 synthase